MKEFVYLIRPTRENFIETTTQEEDTIIDNHFEYLKQLLHDKILILAGPCLDGAFGIVVFKASSLELARKIMENDPVVSSGLMNAELHPYRVSLLQGQ
jgi:uncharacterized protein